MSGAATETVGTLEVALAHAARLLAADPAAAEQQAREVLRAVGEHPEALRILGAALRRQGETEAAEQAYLRSVRASVGDPDLVRAANALVESRLAVAEPILRGLLKTRPTDVAAIRTLQPALADIDYRGAHDGKTIVLRLSDRGARSFASGKYSAWDCLNDVYGLVGTQSYEVARSYTFVQLELKGIYNLEVLAELYGALPEVESAEPSYGVGSGPTLCVQRDAERYQYVVDRASGD